MFLTKICQPFMDDVFSFNSQQEFTDVTLWLITPIQDMAHVCILGLDARSGCFYSTRVANDTLLKSKHAELGCVPSDLWPATALFIANNIHVPL